MIAVDTSALMAIILNEPQAEACMNKIEEADQLLISAGTMSEVLIVASRRGLVAEMDDMLAGLGFDVVPVSASAARRVAQAYQKWGKGVHPASLNFGDCFAYVLAIEAGCPLLYVGHDFSRTDVRSAL